MDIRIKQITIHGFKGCKDLTVGFDDKNTISGGNATGKTTIFDAFTWLMFGKDSLGQTDFAIRPIDANTGLPIHQTEIIVSAILSIDGQEVQYKKTQKENWVKKRGSDAPTFQGNVNSYEVNGYPVSESAFKDSVAAYISEDTFKLLTAPTVFANMPWKEQRQVLVNMIAGDVSDAALLEKMPEFADIASEVLSAPSLDLMTQKYKKTISELKKKQVEIPVRIDELEGITGATDEDVAADEKAAAEAQAALAKALDDMDAKIILRDTITEQIRSAQEEAAAAAIREAKEAHKVLDAARLELANAKNNKDSLEGQLTRVRKSIADYRARAEETKSRLKAIEAEEYTPAKFDVVTICPTCGRPMEEDHIEAAREAYFKAEDAAKEKFQAEKDARLKAIGKQNTEIIEAVTPLMEDERRLIGQVGVADAPIAVASANVARAEIRVQEAEEVAAKSLRTETEEVKALREQFESAVEAVKAAEQAVQDARDIRRLAEDSMVAARVERDSVKAAKDRQEMLRAELRDVAQKITDSEKILYLLERYIAAKMEYVGKVINSRFDNVEFRLFETQINGGLKEICECAVKGVKYSSLNSGERITAGMRILKGLQAAYGTKVPVFIDNAETVNADRFPEMDCQTIFLRVTEDKELVFG